MGIGFLKEKIKKIPIHPVFILLLLWFLCTKNVFSFILFCLVVLSHEFGHYYMAKKLGYKLSSFFIAPYGVCLNYKESTFEQKDEILIAFAGPFVNFVISILCVSLWWIFPVIYNFTQEIVFQSIMLGLFNLLPCYPLDGGRVFVGILSKFYPRQKAIKVTMFINIFVALILFILFFISLFFDFNPSLCFCGVFLVLGLFDSKEECKYQPIALYKKKTKNYSKPLFYTVNGNVQLLQLIKRIELNRYTIFVVVLSNGRSKILDEEKVKSLSIKYPISLTLEEILNDMLFIKER